MVDGGGWFLTKNFIYCRLKEVDTVPVPPAQYSLGLRRKKKLIHTR